MKNKFNLSTETPAPECIILLSELFGQESVLFQCEGQTIQTTATPIAFVGADRRLYSRNNWVGVNPFVFVSEVYISLKNTDESTEVEVVVGKRITLIIYCVAAIVFLVVASVIPEKVRLVFAVASSLFYFMVNYFSGSLLKLEISKKLHAKTLPTHSLK